MVLDILDSFLDVLDMVLDNVDNLWTIVDNRGQTIGTYWTGFWTLQL